jgi:AcrR family transcriptional regulator
MGKQAATKVRAGAEGTGATGKVFPEAPALRLVSSPKRQRILEGMLEAVGNASYDSASVRMVLDRTGLYRQAFYDEFADKDVCYLKALDYGVARFEAIAKAAAESEEDWRGSCGPGWVRSWMPRCRPRDRPGADRRVRGGPEGVETRAEAMKRLTDFIDSAPAPRTVPRRRRRSAEGVVPHARRGPRQAGDGRR